MGISSSMDSSIEIPLKIEGEVLEEPEQEFAE
jgi:hypothetical protein